AMLVIALAIPTVVQGQAIYGTVVDDTARGPVDGAEVDLLHEGAAVAGTVTDSLGRFTIAAPRAGTYGLVVRHAVFMTYQVDSVTLGTGESVTLQIRLGRQAVPLEPLVVTARRSRRGLAGFDERRRAGFGHFIVREDITTRAAGQLTDVLRNVPGLSFRRLRRGGVLTQMRGGASGRCAPAMWVDGIQMQESEQSTLDQIFAPDMIEAVEVYSSHATAPAQYVSGTCGVILFWTRQGSGAEGTPWQWKKVLAGAGAAVLVIILLAR
ncbi:MAG TPA: carboxypeptidase regulatory-like domain-containing protein, partial [Longimicrobiales bacterium]|nr:carboxypeptidase regulatory-like domain-containing protein [Longimicrobiales bacterium]